MDVPILGTIDLTPTGVFLFLAAALAVAYFGWQLFGVGRAGRNASTSDEAAPDASDAQDAPSANDDADGPHKP
jgi:hypothetical protein